MNILIALALLTTVSSISTASSRPSDNQTIESFSKAKKILMSKIYHDHRETLYCKAAYDNKKNITLPTDYKSDKYLKRSKRVEWEHVVPAENFGRTFSQWREGDSQCVNNKGKAYKGRRCANKSSHEYRLMQSDLYNLYPAIGSVNALRSNYNFTMLAGEKSDFGACEMKIANKKAEPPKEARGRIARTYQYMEQTYSRYKMSKAQRQLMNVWSNQYPVSNWECERADRIKNIQGNSNVILERHCN